ncbi:MAG: energy-coupling factor transporter transmembrane protein EcfT [Halobacteriaceae archaeon]
MFAYVPGDSLAHRLDPRTKLAFQAVFAVATFVHATPRGLAALTVVAGGVLLAARTPPRTVAGQFRSLAPFLVGGPALSALTLGSPWVVPARAVPAALASYRVALLLAVSAAYVRSTPARDSRAAVQRLVPGRAGALLGLCVGFVLRFLPLLRADLRRVREAANARLGTERSTVERVKVVGVAGLRRLFRRSDRFALALQARCFAWNPTLPRLAFSRLDWLGLAASAALLAATLLPLVA